MKLRDLHAKALTQAQSAEVEVSSLPQSSAPRPETQQLACSFCGVTEGTWLFNRGTCWAQFICRGCQNKVTMPTAHLCDPALPLTDPCQGQERRQWVCSTCESLVEIESVEEIKGRLLTFWCCPKGCSAGVTPATVAEPPVMVPKTVQ